MVNPNYKFGKSLLSDDDLKKVATCTRELHTFYMQRGKSDDESPIMVALWPGTNAWPKRGDDRQTNSSRYLCHSVISTISSTWMLWIWYFSAASSCKLLQNLICFSLIILYQNVLFASHHLCHVFCFLRLDFFLLIGIWL
jgi:hypothetical protein